MVFSEGEDCEYKYINQYGSLDPETMEEFNFVDCSNEAFLQLAVF